MAHSGGGGSHGGGHHGGSHRGGRGGSGGSARSKRYFPGSYYHHYINRRGRHVYYYSRDPRAARPSISQMITSFLFVGIFWIFLFVMGVSETFSFPGKVKNTVPDGVYVRDEADFLNDREEEQLNEVLDRYYRETGINPCIYLIDKADWNGKYTSLENFGLSEYYRLFQDETHYLVVYSDEVREDGWHDWAFETIVGDDTTKALGTEREDFMSDKLYKEFNRNEDNLCEAFVVSFEALIADSGKVKFNPGVMVVILLFSVFLVFILIAVVSDYLNRRDEYKYSQLYSDSIKNPAEYIMACPECGTKNTELSDICPGCGAPLKRKNLL